MRVGWCVSSGTEDSVDLVADPEQANSAASAHQLRRNANGLHHFPGRYLRLHR